MIRFTLHTLFKNKLLWTWPALFLLFSVVIFIWGDIESAQNSYSFLISIGDAPLPTSFIIPNLLIGISVLIAVIGLPSHFSNNLKSERAALILSKPISRTEYFFSDFAAVLGFSLFYTIISTLLLAILTVAKGFIFPYQLFAGMLLLLPLQIFAYYITISFFLTLMNSYLGGVFLGYFVTGFSSLFLNSDQFLHMLGLNDSAIATAITILSYLIPSAGGAEQLMQGILNSGFSSFDGGLFLFVLITCLPLGALSYYMYLKKEF